MSRAVVTIGLVVAVLLTLMLAMARDIDRLDRRVYCLEHPHGESSTSARMRPDGTVAVGPTARTGCG